MSCNWPLKTQPNKRLLISSKDQLPNVQGAWHRVTSASFIFNSVHTTTEWMPLLEALYLAIKLLGLCPSIPCGNTTRNSCIRLAFYLLRRTSVLFVIITVTKTCTSFIYSAEESLSVGWGWQPGLTWVLFTLLKNIYRLVGIDNKDLH